MDTLDMRRPIYEDSDFPVIVIPGDSNGCQPTGWHEDLEIKVIRSDKLYISLESQILTGLKNEIFLINPYQMHSVPNINGIDLEYILIMISLDFFSVTGIHSISLRKIFMEDHIRFNNHITNPHLSAILENIIAIFPQNSDPFIRIRLQGLFLEFFSILLCEEISDVTDIIKQNHTRYYNTIAPALEAIHRNYDRKITSEELAQLCRLTHSYFCRLFKQVMGITPVQYQTENRLRLADVLLREGMHSIADIAHIVGFEDENYFSRCYKKYRGIAPSRFLK